MESWDISSVLRLARKESIGEVIHYLSNDAVTFRNTKVSELEVMEIYKELVSS